MRRSLATLVAFVLAITLGLGACATDSDSSTAPPPDLPPADTLLQSLATALATGDVTGLKMVGEPAAAQAELETVVEGLGDVKAQVSPGSLSYDGTQATGELKWSWALYPKPWDYTSKATFRLDGQTWRVDWAPSIVHPGLSSRSRLESERLVPKRGRIIGNNGKPLVEESDVVRIGLDKSQLPDAAAQEASARKIAALVGIDADEYVKTVAAHGAKAFVVALIDRGTVPPAGLADIPGGMARPDRMMLTPYRGFGGPLLGTLGEPTKEIIAASGGAVQLGDTVGRSGLQAWHDGLLRGTPGIQVEVVERTNAPAAPSGGPAEVLPALLHKQDKVDGKDLTITLNYDIQTKLEGALASATVPTAMAIVQPSTGKVVALAASPNANNEPIANWGHYPPGSTFKVVSSLALIRSGLSADGLVDCPTAVTVDGRTIQNYPGYPSAHNGQISIKDALAFSCNTAFVTSRTRYTPEALQAAAGSLGLGTDYDAGFTSFFGSVPAPANAVGFAESTFGQGTVEMSPMAVAGMSASVAAGRTVVPWLVEPGPLKPTTQPLTPEEAAQLQAGMQAVVDYGSVSALKGLFVGGKTGTAEFGSGEGMKSHVWLTGYTGTDLAVAAFADTGEYGTDLVPLIQKVLS